MRFNNQYGVGGFGNLPMVTKNLIFINFIIYFSTLLILKVKHYDLTDFLGLHYHLSENFKPHQFITYIFMHDTTSFQHIIMNMLGLYLFGPLLEQVWGPKRFLIYYMLTGYGAAALNYAITGYQIQHMLPQVNAIIDSTTDIAFKAKLIEQKFEYLNRSVVVGASGALYGLLAAYGVLFPNMEMRIYMFIPIKAKWMVLLYGGAELFLGMNPQAGDNVGHFGHLGGLLVGIVLIYTWRRDRNQFY